MVTYKQLVAIIRHSADLSSYSITHINLDYGTRSSVWLNLETSRSHNYWLSSPLSKGVSVVILVLKVEQRDWFAFGASLKLPWMQIHLLALWPGSCGLVLI